jgi:hypothetical protein
MAHPDRISFVQTSSFVVGCLLLLTLTNTGVALAQNPVPLLNQPLVPAAVAPGGSGFTLTVNGSGFVSGSIVHWNGIALATTFISKSRLKAAVLSSDIAKPGTASITVVNPGPGDGTSNVIFFEVAPARASIALSAPTVFSVGAGSYPVSVVVGDFNRDGKLDLAVANWASNNVSVLLGNGDGTLGAAVNYGAGSNPHSVAVGDFNGDGKLDLAVANAGSGNVSVLLGNGDGTFRAAVSYGTGLTPESVAVGDFNGDGKLDLVVASDSSGNVGIVSVLLGNGDGTFQAAVDYGTGFGPSSVGVGDFNGDGKLDLAVANFVGGNVSVLLGNGDGTFRAAVSYWTGSTPESVAVGDFNGDGKLDLAVASDSSGNVGIVSVLLGNGDGTFQAAINYGTGLGPRSVAVGDFNRDGKLDIAVANENSGNVSVLLGNGDGTFQAAANYGAGYGSGGPVSIAVGDFNDDGRLDLAVAEGYGSPFVSVLLQVPTVSLSTTSLNFPYQVVGTRSAAQSVTLTNTSDFTLMISSIAVTGTNATDFSQTHSCGSSLPPGGECGITVTFVPTKLGPRMASLTITDNAAGTPQAIALSGTGVISGPNITLSVTSLTFATQLVGSTSTAQSVTLRNYGTVTLSVTSIGFTGADPGDFHQTNNCGSSITPGASCTISIAFNPTQRGTRTAILTVSDNASGSPQTVSLGGTGTVVQLNPTSLGFGRVQIGFSQSLQATLTNTGSTMLNISSITITGDIDELHQSNNCGSGLGAGKSCTITVTFRPTEFGVDRAQISISHDGGGSPLQVPLSGLGCYQVGRCFL